MIIVIIINNIIVSIIKLNNICLYKNWHLFAPTLQVSVYGFDFLSDICERVSILCETWDALSIK